MTNEHKKTTKIDVGKVVALELRLRNCENKFRFACNKEQKQIILSQMARYAHQYELLTGSNYVFRNKWKYNIHTS